MAAGHAPAAIAGTAAMQAGEAHGRTLHSADELPTIDGLEIPGPLSAGDLGWIHERALDAGHRRREGVHYTPAPVALRLAELTIRGSRHALVCDPAVGGGAFLLAAAQHLRVLGVDPVEIVEDRLWGIDLDPVAVAVTRAALELWGAEQGVSAVPPQSHLICADTLTVGAESFGGMRFDVVLGNPPFQSQLGSTTARSASMSAELRRRWSVAPGPYADTAAWFLAAGLELAAPGGRITFVEPQSVLVAADAAPIRELVGASADLVGLWWGGRGVFAADVAVCAPVLRRHDEAEEAESPGERRVARWDGASVVAVESAPVPVGSSWGPLVADLLGAPPVTPVSAGSVGDVAAATAGFRDEYYAVTAHLDDDPDGAGPRLVTVGMIDTLHDRWGTSSFRIARESWRHPRVDMAGLADEAPRIADWVRDRLTPKILVATQTKVVEAVAEEVEEAAITAATPQRLKACAQHWEIMSPTTTRKELRNK